MSAHNSDKQAALKSLNTFMEPSVQSKWDKLQSFVSAESAVPTSDPTALAVASEVKTEKVHLTNRYWEATPPRSRSRSRRPVQVHLEPRPLVDAVPEDPSVGGHVVLVDGQELAR